MRIAILLVASLALAATALPAASAGHTWTQCMYGTWYPSPPPGWEHFCAVNDWLAHDPFTPTVDCIGDAVIIVGIELDDALACLV